MAGKRKTLEERIKDQQDVVFKAKDKYENAVADLDKLLKKRDEAQKKELVKAFTESDRSLQEVLDFLRGCTKSDCEDTVES